MLRHCLCAPWSVIMVLLMTLTACGGSSPVAPVNAAANGVAIAGADPVAYFVSADYHAGSSEFTHEWNGATWHFANAANRDAFVAAPRRYAPQFGGYCAWAVSRNYTAAIDPTAWKIVDDKLYLNYNAQVQQRWAKEERANIAQAEKNWPSLQVQQ